MEHLKKEINNEKYYSMLYGNKLGTSLNERRSHLEDMWSEEYYGDIINSLGTYDAYNEARMDYMSISCSYTKLG